MTKRCSLSAWGRIPSWDGRVPIACVGQQAVKLRHITQIKARPPSFVVFGTRLDDLPASYERYLVNSIRKELGFGAVPVRLTMRSPKNPFSRD